MASRRIFVPDLAPASRTPSPSLSFPARLIVGVVESAHRLKRPVGLRVGGMRVEVASRNPQARDRSQIRLRAQGKQKMLLTLARQVHPEMKAPGRRAFIDGIRLDRR